VQQPSSDPLKLKANVEFRCVKVDVVPGDAQRLTLP